MFGRQKQEKHPCDCGCFVLALMIVCLSPFALFSALSESWVSRLSLEPIRITPLSEPASFWDWDVVLLSGDPIIFMDLGCFRGPVFAACFDFVDRLLLESSTLSCYVFVCLGGRPSVLIEVFLVSAFESSTGS